MVAREKASPMFSSTGRALFLVDLLLPPPLEPALPFPGFSAIWRPRLSDSIEF
jgi:hypothetical protein